MYPEDRVLVGVMTRPGDLQIAREQHWYRIPQSSAPRGIDADYIAFYLTGKFDDALKWGIRYYARRVGHELVRRRELLPAEATHPRAEQAYYKIQLGPLLEKTPPIASTKWRRITFIQTTWDRFQAAREIKDLYSKDPQFVDRIYHALRETGLRPMRDYRLEQGGTKYKVDLAIICKQGIVAATTGEGPPDSYLLGSEDLKLTLNTLRQAVIGYGGLRTLDAPLE